MSSYEYLVGVGSNLGDRRATIAAAQRLLEERGVIVKRSSALHETAPLGAADQLFLNAAWVCSSSLAPESFMKTLLNVERSLGRVREVRWGNRSIDLDILMARDPEGKDIECSLPDLVIPHPRFHEREFAMKPAREIWDFRKSPSSQLWWKLIILGTLARLGIAYCLPFGNDEAYYWDWGRRPQWSYFDHPPLVSWISYLGEHLWPFSPELGGRLLVPFLYMIASIFFVKIAEQCVSRPLLRKEQLAAAAVTQIIPAFSLGGFMLMPDAGLFLFVTLAVWYVGTIYQTAHLRKTQGIVLGVFLGFAGLSKYLAFPVALGLMGWFLYQRRSQLKNEVLFWINLILTGLLIISPVFIWNYQNEWASFAYQGGRGLSGGSFNASPALRTLLAELAFLGPLYVIGAFQWFKDKPLLNVYEKRILWAALPLIVILKIFSFTSQTLPHWSMPAWWLLAVLLVRPLAKSRNWIRPGLAYGALFCGVLPLVLGSSTLRTTLYELMKNRPAALGELTLWDEAARTPEIAQYIHDTQWLESYSTIPSCEKPFGWAAIRWFTVAQVAANFPTHPFVQNLDPDHISYYHFRTPRTQIVDCPMVLLTEKSHWQGFQGHPEWQSITFREFLVPHHFDRPIVIAKGIFLHKSSSGSDSGSR